MALAVALDSAHRGRVLLASTGEIPAFSPDMYSHQTGATVPPELWTKPSVFVGYFRVYQSYIGRTAM